MSLPTVPIAIREDIFRIAALEVEWDISVVVYEPAERAHAALGPDGKKVGVFLLHGGVSDYKSVQRIARILAEQFAIKVMSMTFPGRFSFPDPSGDWPNEVEHDEVFARTPRWTRATHISPDQYTIVRDTSKRRGYGTLISLSGKPGTEFYQRMSAWPGALETALKETARRHTFLELDRAEPAAGSGAGRSTTLV